MTATIEQPQTGRLSVMPKYGYRGRIGIFELPSVDDTVRQMIADGATEQQIEAHAFVDNALLASSGRALVPPVRPPRQKCCALRA